MVWKIGAASLQKACSHTSTVYGQSCMLQTKSTKAVLLLVCHNQLGCQALTARLVLAISWKLDRTSKLDTLMPPFVMLSEHLTNAVGSFSANV